MPRSRYNSPVPHYDNSTQVARLGRASESGIKRTKGKESPSVFDWRARPLGQDACDGSEVCFGVERRGEERAQMPGGGGGGNKKEAGYDMPVSTMRSRRRMTP